MLQCIALYNCTVYGAVKRCMAAWLRTPAVELRRLCDATRSTFQTAAWPRRALRVLRAANTPHAWQQQSTLAAKNAPRLSVEFLTKTLHHEKAFERSATPVSDQITMRSLSLVRRPPAGSASTSQLRGSSPVTQWPSCGDAPANPSGSTKTLSPVVMKAYASSSSTWHLHGWTNR